MSRTYPFVTGVAVSVLAFLSCDGGEGTEGGGDAGHAGHAGSGGSSGAGGSGAPGGTAGAGTAGTGGGASGASGAGTAGTAGTAGVAGTGGQTASDIWRPAPGTSWQWQLTGDVDTSLDVTMYDVDLFVSKSVIDELHQHGRVVICYFSAGSWEEWRDDASAFPASAIGNELDGWPDERWLDIRDATVRSIMQARLDHAVQQGCDGVEPDNVDGYTNDPGFDFDAADQLDYNRFIAKQAHVRGLSVGLKNDLAQVEQLVDDFDWALNEECMEWTECEELLPFIQAGKAVFHVEYGGASLASAVCPHTQTLGFSTLIKNLQLDAWRVACP